MAKILCYNYFKLIKDYVAPVRELPPMPVSDMVDEDAD
jgi:hypothetical protein